MRDHFFNGINVLVTGAAGLAGSNIVAKLISIGAHVRAIVHLKAPVIQDKRIEYVKADLTAKQDCIRVVQDMDVVFHCAASTSGAAVIEKTPLAHVTPNLVMNAQLLEAAYIAKVNRFLWLSSTVAYPPSGTRPIEEEELLEGEPFEKYHFAGWMKRYTEILCQSYSTKLKDPLMTVVLRPTNIYGEHDDFNFETSHVLPALIRKVVERHDPIEVWGDGEDIRDFIYVGDFVEACIMAMEKVVNYCPMNIGYGKGYSVKEVLNIILEEADYRDARILFNPSKPSMIPIRLVNISKAKRILGFEPKIGIREGIQKTLEWYRLNPMHI